RRFNPAADSARSSGATPSSGPRIRRSSCSTRSWPSTRDRVASRQRDETKFDEYQHLLFERRDDGILLITINRPELLNATNNRLHWELSHVWLDIADDPETRVVVITGAGRAFSAGGDLDMIEKMAGDPANVAQAWKEAGDIVYNIINLDKPV